VNVGNVTLFEEEEKFLSGRKDVSDGDGENEKDKDASVTIKEQSDMMEVDGPTSSRSGSGSGTASGGGGGSHVDYQLYKVSLKVMIVCCCLFFLHCIDLHSSAVLSYHCCATVHHYPVWFSPCN
jgi:hypothetical protein